MPSSSAITSPPPCPRRVGPVAAVRAEWSGSCSRSGRRPGRSASRTSSRPSWRPPWTRRSAWSRMTTPAIGASQAALIEASLSFWRQVDHQVVQLGVGGPGQVVHELAHAGADHRAAPDHGQPTLQDEAEGGDADPVLLHDSEARVGLETYLQAQHRRHVGAGDVGVQQTDPRAEPPAARSPRLTATVDLPTPPLFEATAMMLRTPVITSGPRPTPVVRLPVASIWTSACLTPGSASSRPSAWVFISSLTGQAGVVRTIRAQRQRRRRC